MSKKGVWPTKAVMEQIYSQNLWGTDGSEFYSGEGSHKPEIVNAYVGVVQSFLNSFTDKLEVCDLGCGDFNIGQHLVAYSKKYIAVDIVPDLITRNQKEYALENLEFQCLDISKDKLPQGDCAIIRQVFQHLSNAEISSILEKLTPYTYLIVTEHLPQHHFEANKDSIASQGIRLKKESGVDLLQPPFNLQPKESNELLVHPLGGNKGQLVTTLYTL